MGKCEKIQNTSVYSSFYGNVIWLHWDSESKTNFIKSKMAVNDNILLCKLFCILLFNLNTDPLFSVTPILFFILTSDNLKKYNN